LATFSEFVDQLFDESPMIQGLRKSFFEEGFQAGIRQGLEQEIQQEELKSIQQLGSVAYASPTIQHLHKRFFAEGFQEGTRQRLVQGMQREEMETVQDLQARLVTIVQAKYPELAEFAQEQANRFSDPVFLNFLISQVTRASNINRAYMALEAKAFIQEDEKEELEWSMIKLLAQQPCTKCPVDTPQMTDEEISKWRKHIPDWQVASDDGILQLTCEYYFDNFSTALAFTNALGALAEREGHYPRLVTEWSTVRVDWWTPYIGGLHLNDFIMAAKTEIAYDEFVTEQDPPRGLVGAMLEMYPSLEEVAREQASRFDTPEMLKLIIRQVLAAPDVDAARELLETGPE
jgi:4a-hydroxytetrahydrobiopterin dehydratase